MSEKPVPQWTYFHPGVHLADELRARGWTQKHFAELIHRPTGLVNRLITGKSNITPRWAVEIGAALGTSAEFWMNLDSAWRLNKYLSDMEEREQREHEKLARTKNW